MKTAGRENPNRWTTLASNRAHGAADQNRSCSIKWAAKVEQFRPREKFFFLTFPLQKLFYRTYQELVKFIELFVGHRGHGSVRVLVETIQRDVFSWNEASLHKALNDDTEASIWFWLYDDSDCC